ncbi:hypothetical protein ACTJLC_21890 [Paraburkholderia sp. 22099]|uniref:hypothetical protein n=1 Tax=Paraburkholderia sp. 22099 TaxID=3453875 RepID=UPI003F86EDA1
MADRLMANEKLKLVTGKQRYSKQAKWFRRQFNFDPPRSGKNAVVVTWPFQRPTLNAGHFAFTQKLRSRPQLCSPLNLTMLPHRDTEKNFRWHLVSESQPVI